MLFTKIVSWLRRRRSHFLVNKFTPTKKMEIIHIDLSGPARTRESYGERYFMIFVDNFIRMMQETFLKEKFQAFQKFKIFKNRVENESSVKINFLRLDRGGEFISREFNMFCE